MKNVKFLGTLLSAINSAPSKIIQLLNYERLHCVYINTKFQEEILLLIVKIYKTDVHVAFT